MALVAMLVALEPAGTIALVKRIKNGAGEFDRGNNEVNVLIRFMMSLPGNLRFGI